MASKDFFKVPKLQKDGSNWVTFRERLRWALDARGILDHIERVVPEPGTIASELQEIEGETGKSAGGMTDQLHKWKMNEALAKQVIASTLPDSVFN